MAEARRPIRAMLVVNTEDKVIDMPAGRGVSLELHLAAASISAANGTVLLQVPLSTESHVGLCSNAFQLVCVGEKHVTLNRRSSGISSHDVQVLRWLAKRPAPPAPKGFIARSEKTCPSGAPSYCTALSFPQGEVGGTFAVVTSFGHVRDAPSFRVLGAR